jgi:hypothetical protein
MNAKWSKRMRAAEQAEEERTYRAIGRFIFEFSQVEYTIRHYLAQEIRLKDEHFSPIIESYDVGILTTVAKEVFGKSRRDKNKDDIIKLLDRFWRLNGHRKRVAHGLWVPHREGGTVHYVPRSKLTATRSTDQAMELEKVADELCQLRDDLEKAFLHVPEMFKRNR